MDLNCDLAKEREKGMDLNYNLAKEKEKKMDLERERERDLN